MHQHPCALREPLPNEFYALVEMLRDVDCGEVPDLDLLILKLLGLKDLPLGTQALSYGLLSGCEKCSKVTSLTFS
mgnify:FL=1